MQPQSVSNPVLADYLTEADLAQALGVTDRTIRSWHARRVGPPRVLIGRKPYYRLEAVRIWLEARESSPVRRRRAGAR